MFSPLKSKKNVSERRSLRPTSYNAAHPNNGSTGLDIKWVFLKKSNKNQQVVEQNRFLPNIKHQLFTSDNKAKCITHSQ
jgi:hypothetical protein